MKSHIDTLCAENSIKLEHRRTGGRAWSKSRRVSIAPVRSAITYAVALHEIGHILGRSPRTRLDREAAAWTWARANAIEWTPVMERRMQNCLDAYAKWFTRKRLRGIPVAGSGAFDLLRGEALTVAFPRFPK